MVELQPSKLIAGVRFPLPAPKDFFTIIVLCPTLNLHFNHQHTNHLSHKLKLGRCVFIMLIKFAIKDIVADKKDKTHIVLREKKTGKSKSFRINDALRDIINDYVALMDSESFLIPSRKKTSSIRRQQAYRILTAAGKKVGINGEIGCHTLRKSFGYHFYKNYQDIALLQKIFNHSSPSITLRYIGITQDIMDDAIDDFSL
jgi:integrase